MKNKIAYILIFSLLFFSHGFTAVKKNYKLKKWEKTVKKVVQVKKVEAPQENPDWPQAGYIYDEFNLTLTNKSSDINFYYEKIRELIEIEADILPGAKLALGLKDTIFQEGWDKNNSFLVKVPVKISGPEMRTFQSTVRITFSRQEAAVKEGSYIFLSNNPEVIKKPGVLFWGDISGKSTVEFLYYHMNGMSTICRFYTVLENLSKIDVKVLLVSGKGGPHKDGISVGHVATKRFFRNYFYNRGMIVTLPPEGFKVIAKDDLLPNDINSGFINIGLLDEGKIRVETIAVDPYSEGIAKIFKAEKVGKGQQRGVFKASKVKVTKYYEVGNDVDGSFVSMGVRPYIQEVNTGEELKGNYGLWHEFYLEIFNKTQSPKIVQLYLLPAGGLARAVLFLNEKIVETPLLNPYGDKFEDKLISFKLQPNQGKDLRIITMPQPGVYYPVRLAFREKEIGSEPEEVTENGSTIQPFY